MQQRATHWPEELAQHAIACRGLGVEVVELALYQAEGAGPELEDLLLVRLG